MSEDLAEAIARTRRRYDETPYLSGPIQRSHPGRLAAVALWRGLAAPEAARARVLEIGCASGGNLLPMAATMPEARFLGVDLSPAQIAAGEARRDRLGIANVEFRAASFESLGEADGAFDFILCHGVYSWIPEALRDSLLGVICDRLAPHGVAYVSFNVLPGWRLFQIARDSLRLAARGLEDPAARAARSRQLFSLLATQSPERHTYGQFWRREAQRMSAGGDAYLEHEVFEDDNAPESFADFSARLARFGLDYLGESAVSGNNPAAFVSEAAEAIEALADGDRGQRETYVDIFTGRSFREALIVRAGRAAALAAAPPVATWDRLHVLPGLDLKGAADPDEASVYRLGDGETELTFRGLDVGAALARLVARKPASSSFADLRARAEAREALAEALRLVVEFGLAAVTTAPVACAAALAERPTLWPLAAEDAVTGERTATLRHAGFKYQPLQRFLAPRLDGSRTRDELVDDVVALAVNGQLTVNGPDGPVTDPAEIRRRLSASVDDALDGLLRHGLLTPP